MQRSSVHAFVAWWASVASISRSHVSTKALLVTISCAEQSTTAHALAHPQLNARHRDAAHPDVVHGPSTAATCSRGEAATTDAIIATVFGQSLPTEECCPVS